MKKILISSMALSLLAGSAFANTSVVENDNPASEQLERMPNSLPYSSITFDAKEADYSYYFDDVSKNKIITLGSDDGKEAKMEYEPIGSADKNFGNIKFTCPDGYEMPDIIYGERVSFKYNDGKSYTFKLKKGVEKFDYYVIWAQTYPSAHNLHKHNDSTIKFLHNVKKSKDYYSKKEMQVVCVPPSHVNDYELA